MKARARAAAAITAPHTLRAVPSSDREKWQRAYQARLWVTDALVIVAAVMVAQYARFGDVIAEDSRLAWALTTDVGYTTVSAVIALLWFVDLSLLNTRSPRVIGGGAEEYRRIVIATMRLFGVIAIVSVVVHIDIARGYLAIALPVGLLGLLLTRRAWRRYAIRQRRKGKYQTSVLIVGGRHAAQAVARSFARDTASGYRVVGVCMPPGARGDAGTLRIGNTDVPILGDENAVVEAVRTSGADTVAVTDTEHLGPDGIRNLVWALEPMGVDLVVTPNLVDVAARRVEIRPVADMPLVHIEKPQYDGAKSFGKQAFDFCFALFALIAIAPVMAAIAVIVRFSSRGPVFYRSERVGIDGKPFQMIKFRSMYEDADKHLSALLEMNEGAGLLFKMRNDPRITPVGKVLRKYSLDELPQFLNVLRGEMSVVGPRPPLRREVERYDGVVSRRLLVKPGVTGLWQVSGRSDLSWEESVRLDLSYVENWSMVQDLLIIKKTITTVATADGAY